MKAWIWRITAGWKRNIELRRGSITGREQGGKVSDRLKMDGDVGK